MQDRLSAGLHRGRIKLLLVVEGGRQVVGMSRVVEEEDPGPKMMMEELLRMRVAESSEASARPTKYLR